MPRSSSSAVLTALGAGRVVLGAAFLARPTAFPRLMGVDSATAGRVAWQGQMIGAREVGLGVGLLTSLRGNPAPWLLAGALADAADAVAFSGGARRGDVRRVGHALGAIAAATAAYGVLAARRTATPEAASG